MNLVVRDDINPVCPHCQAPLASLFCQEVHATLGRRYVYFCPQCLKILGVSHRKGFWMG